LSAPLASPLLKKYNTRARASFSLIKNISSHYAALRTPCTLADGGLRSSRRALQYLQSQGLIKKVMSYEMEQWQQSNRSAATDAFAFVSTPPQPIKIHHSHRRCHDKQHKSQNERVRERDEQLG
jgi:hypothetical protein